MPHIHEKIDFTAEALIVHQGKVLLRMHDKYKIWLPPGGHIELDEDPNQAAIREAKEETGLEIVLHPSASIPNGNGAQLVVPAFINRHHINESHEHVSMIFLATTQSAELAPAATEDQVEMRWFSGDELDDEKFGIRPEIKAYAKHALKTLKGE